jgi:hypothetical protein
MSQMRGEQAERSRKLVSIFSRHPLSRFCHLWLRFDHHGPQTPEIRRNMPKQQPNWWDYVAF